MISHVWGEETKIPGAEQMSQGNTVMPVICGQGACTLSFTKDQPAPDHKSLPFQRISDTSIQSESDALSVCVAKDCLRGRRVFCLNTERQYRLRLYISSDNYKAGTMPDYIFDTDSLLEKLSKLYIACNHCSSLLDGF